MQSDYFWGTLCIHNKGTWHEPIYLCGSTVQFKIDTGADVSIISQKIWESILQPKPNPKLVILCGPGGRLKCLRRFTTKAKCKGRDYLRPIVVILSQQ